MKFYIKTIKERDGEDIFSLMEIIILDFMRIIKEKERENFLKKIPRIYEHGDFLKN